MTRKERSKLFDLADQLEREVIEWQDRYRGLWAKYFKLLEKYEALLRKFRRG